MKFYLLILAIVSCYGSHRDLQLLPWKKSSSSKENNFLQKQKLKIQAYLVRTAALSYLDQQLEHMSIPKTERARIHHTGDQIINKTIDLYISMNQTQRTNLEKFIKNVPKQFSSLSDIQETQAFDDIKYFQSLDLERQSDLYGHIAQQISLLDLDYVNKTQEVQNLQLVLSKIHDLVDADRKNPSQDYNVSGIWKPVGFNLDEDDEVQDQIEELITDRNISQALEGFLAGRSDINLNKTFNDMGQRNKSRLDQTKREEIRKQLDDFVQKSNPFILVNPDTNRTHQHKQNSTNKLQNHTTNNSSNILAVNQQVTQFKRLPVYLGSTVILMLLLGVCYFFKRRRDFKNRIQQQIPIEVDLDSSL